MGLDDLVPDSAGGSSSSSRSSRDSSDDDEESEKVIIGSEPYKKVFTDEDWEGIKGIITQEMGYVPNEVVNNYPAEERYEILHEAALLYRSEISEEELSDIPRKCDYCGAALRDGGVWVGEYYVCASHTAGQLATLDDEN